MYFYFTVYYIAMLKYRFYTQLYVKKDRVCCKHLHMYRCVYNTNIKESIRWDMYIYIYMGLVNKPRPWAMPTDSVCLLS